MSDLSPTPDTAAPTGAPGHRNGCTGCDHQPEAFPGCWTDEQVSEEYARMRRLVTGESEPARSVAGTAAPLVPDEAWQAVEDLYTAHRVDLDDLVRTAVSVAFSAALAAQPSAGSGTAALTDPPTGHVVIAPPEPEALAAFFHETYERLAPSYDYRTRPDSAVPWADVPARNKRLMTDVARHVITWLADRAGDGDE